MQPPSDQRKLLFVTGSARGGTTWTQLLLAQHERIATAQEPHLFMHYLSHVERRWQFDVNRREERRQVGLPTLFSREELVELYRVFALRMFDAIQARSPGADVLLYKGDIDQSALIHEVLPEAYFIHVIRDPRSVACSMRAASGDFGKQWAPKSLLDAVGMWSDAVQACRAVHDRTDRYTEVNYEALSADAVAELTRLYTWLGLEAERPTVEAAVEACAIGKMKKKQAAAAPSKGAEPWDIGKEPQGFFRNGRPDGWREELGPAELAAVEFAAKDLMQELGYELVGDGRKPSVVNSSERRERISNFCERIAGAVIKRIRGQRP